MIRTTIAALETKNGQFPGLGRIYVLGNKTRGFFQQKGAKTKNRQSRQRREPNHDDHIAIPTTSGRDDVDQFLGIPIERLTKQVPFGRFRTGVIFSSVLDRIGLRHVCEGDPNLLSNGYYFQ
jgi:hypothetical protein